MALLAFLGRTMLAFLFLSSGLQKLQSYDMATGGPVMKQMGPKMDSFVSQVDDLVKQASHAYKLPIDEHVRVPELLRKEYYPALLGVAIFLEVAGSVLFVLNKPIGAQMLLLFTVPVSVVMHDFWNLEAGSPEQFVDMVMFFKNVALVGALLMFLGMRR